MITYKSQLLDLNVVFLRFQLGRGDGDLKYAVSELCADLVHVHIVRNREAPLEFAKLALRADELVAYKVTSLGKITLREQRLTRTFFVLHGGLLLALELGVAFIWHHIELNVVLLDARELGVQHNRILFDLEVDCREGNLSMVTKVVIAKLLRHLAPPRLELIREDIALFDKIVDHVLKSYRSR